jgi:hypothetical protein
MNLTLAAKKASEGCQVCQRIGPGNGTHGKCAKPGGRELAHLPCVPSLENRGWHTWQLLGYRPPFSDTTG